MDERVRRRVLMLIPELGFGGAERSFLHLERILARHHDVTVVAFEPPDPARMTVSLSGAEFACLHRRSARPAIPGRARRWLERIVRLREIKEERRIEVAISFLEGADLLNVLTRRAERVVVSIRGSKVFDPHISGLQGLVRRHVIWPIVYPRADAVVSVSAGVSAEVQRLGFVGRGRRAATIGLALQVPALVESSRRPVEPELHDLARSPVIVSWGRLSDEKGFHHLLRVFSRLRRRMPSAKLLLVGDGPMRDELVALAQRMGLSVSPSRAPDGDPDVVFTGYRSDPNRYASLAKVFVLPSLTEGFPNAVVEALAAGALVMATDGPWGARSVLNVAPRDLGTPFPTTERTFADFGVLMPRIDHAAFESCWVDALADALAGGERYDEYRRTGPIRAMAFDEGRAAASWLDLIEELTRDLDGPRRTRGAGTA
jgi:glycosyltransferase involved in cell wall biosynthesis